VAPRPGMAAESPESTQRASLSDSG
jgi:hypothetical protein